MANDAHGSPTLENLFTETRTFPPLASFAAHANAKADEYDRARADRLGYWREQAERLAWHTPFTEVLDWSDAPVARWFADGTLNACDNAVDRHVREGRGDRVAFHFEGEPGDTQTLTYNDMHERVQKAANGLLSLGSRQGRPRRDLPPADSRSRCRDARVRAHRRDPLRRVRRLLRGEPSPTHRRRRGQARHHGRRRQPAGCPPRPEAPR